MGDTEALKLDIPAFLKRDANNRAEFMMDESVSEVESSRPAKTKIKANGHAKPTVKTAPVKAASKSKAKATAKAPDKAKAAPKATAKAAKAPDKAKVAKPKAEGAEKDQFGLRKGSIKSKAAAMYARKNGATLNEVKEALGSVQLNVLNSLEEAGHKVEKEKVERKGQRPVTRYRLTPKN